MEQKTMKASRLISLLVKAIEKYGDQPVYKTIEEPKRKGQDNSEPLLGYVSIGTEDKNGKYKSGKFILCDSDDLDSFH